MSTAPATATSASAQSKSDIDQLKDDVRAVRADFAALASSTGKLAAGQFKKQSQRASDLAGTAAEKASVYRDLIADRVKERPFASIGAAVLIGLALSSLRRR